MNWLANSLNRMIGLHIEPPPPKQQELSEAQIKLVGYLAKWCCLLVLSGFVSLLVLFSFLTGEDFGVGALIENLFKIEDRRIGAVLMAILFLLMLIIGTLVDLYKWNTGRPQ